jgi:predicted O-methyltransferase YrrM
MKPSPHPPNHHLSRLYETYCNTASDINEHLPLIRRLTMEVEATKVLELGVRGGVSTVAFLSALEVTGGMLLSVDIDMPAFDVDVSRWMFLKADDTTQYAKTLIGQLAYYDVIFIDTSHAYLHTHEELISYAHFIRPGGVLMMHDVNVKSFPHHDGIQPDYPVRKALDDWTSVFESFHEGTLEWIHLPNNNGFSYVFMPQESQASDDDQPDSPDDVATPSDPE